MENLNKDFWNERYRSSQTGWDLKAPSPPLTVYINSLENKNLHILIPGCGNAYEAEYLLEKGFTNITLVDIAEEAIMRLQQKFKGKPIQIIHSDFFEHQGKYDVILEQTFFCAIHPSLRTKYVQHVHHLLKENGVLAGLLFNCNFEKEGPPFGGELTEYQQLFQPYFETKHMKLATNSVKPRAGNELFIQLIKKQPSLC
ncbi:MAG: methyltransferase domain-containing protein [Chitinophagales bacterium]|nr:methyltransferase domain-containing protein [Chitinophagales bacterium]